MDKDQQSAKGSTAGISENSLQWILKNLEGLQYGSVQITVHQGKIVQIDRTEKNRLEL